MGCGLAGYLLLGSSNDQLHEVVNLHNANLLNRFLPRTSQVDLRLFPLRDGAGVRASYRF